MDRREAIARLGLIKTSDAKKEIYVLVKLFKYSQRSVAKYFEVSEPWISFAVSQVSELLEQSQSVAITPEIESAADWRSDRTRLQCELADALQREKFLQDKCDRLARREFWRSELRVPRIQEIKRV